MGSSVSYGPGFVVERGGQPVGIDGGVGPDRTHHRSRHPVRLISNSIGFGLRFERIDDPYTLGCQRQHVVVALGLVAKVPHQIGKLTDRRARPVRGFDYGIGGSDM